MSNLNPIHEALEVDNGRIKKLEKQIAASTNPLQRQRLYAQYQELMRRRTLWQRMTGQNTYASHLPSAAPQGQ